MVDPLGCKYLRIDTLCIVQNSDSDKEVELSKMRGIYQKNFLTIAAADGEDSYAGILCSRKRVLSVHVKCSESTIQPIASVRLRVKTSLEKDVHDRQLPQPHFGGPLSLRVWTLQERILPHRVLHYCNTQLVWGCCTKTARKGRRPSYETEVEFDKGKLGLLVTFCFGNEKAFPAIMVSDALDGSTTISTSLHT